MELATPASVGRETQSTIYRNGASGSRPRVPTAWRALKGDAQRTLSPEALAYIAGSSGLESTADANRAAFDHWRILPRMLRDVSQRDPSVKPCGHRYPSPVMAAPVGVLEPAHRDADRAVARATADLGIPYVFPRQASHSEVRGRIPALFDSGVHEVFRNLIAELDLALGLSGHTSISDVTIDSLAATS